MRSGIYAPTLAEYADPRVHVELATAAEEAGWDGYFVFDHLVFMSELPLAEAFVTLSGVAVATQRIRIGPMITPLARRRPWQLGKELATLDHLSGGRLVLGVGLGGPPDEDFGNLGEDGSPKVLAEKLDEGLEVLHGLFGDEPYTFEGKHYQVHHAVLRPKPVQTPRIPVWVAGFWPNRRPFRRAARWDGCFPLAAVDSFEPGAQDDGVGFQQMWLPPARYREVSEFFAKERKTGDPFELVAAGSTANDDPAAAAAKLVEYREAGATWWLEWLSDAPGSLEKARELIERGPPRTR